ncbi:hypothetical protein K491DRAFT_722962 [Lophiostoma macrostomum CBS 122681]|uniref:Uncharacterized protein n=1 Tax=Lophiostoma macrostomum CBS 122681 TaxID=1314788 RepID=A0A6A6SKP8_9PLEO|nr:hypothetical protein K491DRAFT_722962 [Lophiostoma macrostomum CBS 122681]
MSNNIVYLRPLADAPGVKRFADIQPQIQSTMRLDTTKNFAEELQRGQPKSQHAIYGCTSFFITPMIMQKINTAWKSASANLIDIDNLMTVLTY